MKYLIISFLFIFISCSAEKAKTSQARLKISARNFATSTAPNPNQPHPTLIALYLTNLTKNKQQSIFLTEQEINLEIEYGEWRIVVLDWSQVTGLRCGKALKNFNQKNDSIAIEVSEDECDSNFFSPEAFRKSNGNIKPLGFLNCQKTSTISNGLSCPPAGQGGIASMKISPIFHDEVALNQLPQIDLNSVELMIDECVALYEFDESFTPSQMQVPVGSTDFKMPVLLETYYNDDCSGDKVTSYFPYGLNAGSFTSTTRLYNTTDYVNIFVEHLDVYPVGTKYFTASTSDDVENDFFLVNNSNAPITNISISIGSPFSINNACPINLSARSTCSFSVIFEPGTDYFVEKNISIFYTQNGKRLEKEFKIYGIYLGQINYETLEANLFTQIEINADSDVPGLTCSVIMLNNLILTRPCYCDAAGLCSVDIISSTSSSGIGDLLYIVDTDSGPQQGQMIFTINSSDDLRTQHLSNQFIQDTDLDIDLNYESSHLPTSCSVTLLDSNLDPAVSSCSCDQGNCTATVRGDPGYSGSAFFYYNMTYTDSNANNQTSNSSKVLLIESPNFTNNFEELISSLGASSIISDIVKTSDGLIYAGTAGDFRLTADEGMSLSDTIGPGINSLHVNRANTIYLATIDNGLQIVPNNAPAYQLLSGDILDVTTDYFGNIYVATFTGLRISRDGGATFESITSPDIPSDLVTRVFTNNIGGVFVATSTGVAISLDFGLSFIPLNSGESVNDIVSNSQGQVFIATGTGVKRIETDYSFSNLLLAGNAQSLFIDSNDVLYVGTDNGLKISVDNGDSFQPFSGNTSSIKRIFIDQDGAIYLATTNGILVSYSNVILAVREGSQLSQIDFGNVTGSTSKTVEVYNLGNTGTSNFTVAISSANVELTSSAPTNNCGGVIPKNSYCEVTLYWNNNSVSGTKSGTLLLEHNLSNDFSVNVTGTQQ